MSLRIIFMGTPDFSVPTLSALVDNDHQVVACYSQPPRPAGRRGLEFRKGPVLEKAEQLGIPVLTPDSLKSDDQHTVFSQFDADVAVVIAYGMLLPQAILSAPRFGCFNGHASILPRWRGAAPIQRALIAGDHETGVSIMKMDAGLDTGPVALEHRIAIDETMTAGTLHDALSRITARLMVDAISALETDTLTLSPQPEHGITYAEKISKDETRVDWSQPATVVHNRIRGLSPFPGAWCEMQIGGKRQRVKILNGKVVSGTGASGTVLDDGLTIACGTDAWQPILLQRAGKQVQELGDFLRGNTVEGVF